jgi:hypothetical protein
MAAMENGGMMDDSDDDSQAEDESDSARADPAILEGEDCSRALFPFSFSGMLALRVTGSGKIERSR